MTPTATYIAEENCLQEISQMEKHHFFDLYVMDIGLTEEEFKQLRPYLDHLKSLRRIPCDPSCKGLWADGQKLVVGKDYGVRDYPIRAMLPTDPKFIAFPLVPVKSEDELWREAISVIKDCVKRESWDTIMAELKSKYSLTKR